MTANDFPVRPELRIVSRHEYNDYRVILLEQPDITVDEPYTLIIMSSNKDMGTGHSIISYTTKVEPAAIRDELLRKYLALPDKRHLATISAQINAQLMTGPL